MCSFPLLFLYSITVFIVIASASNIVFHKNYGRDGPIVVTGDHCESGLLFDEAQEFTCACTTGLWALFRENCEQAYMIVGGTKEQCVHLDFAIHKAVLLSSEDEDFLTQSSATVFDTNVASIGGKFISSNETRSIVHFVSSGFPIVITAGNQSWRLPLQKLCLKPTPQEESNRPQFCIFSTGVYDEYRMDESDCDAGDKALTPLSCTSFMQDEDSESRSCSRRKRRKAKGLKARHNRMRGRAFLDTIQKFKEPPSEPEAEINITAADENSGLDGGTANPVMNSELWNYMTLRAQEMLGIRERRRKEKGEGSYEPAFTFLEISKEIQQKACPDHYVTDEHYDVAVGAFISILKNHYKFTDPFLDFATSERIEDTLRACLASIKEYPFLERTGKPNPNLECNDSKPIEHGAYYMFDQTLDMTLGHDLASRSNEPIVETVWKIFIHAHSACYEFFGNNLNDHHRFATVMLQLFTSEINDLWFNVTELQSDIYTGFLGDAVDLMDSVAYCSIFSRLESKYPWDLPRPKKYNAGEGGGAAPPASRRKRDVDESDDEPNPVELHSYKCLQHSDARNFCPSTEYLSSNLEEYNFIRGYV